MLAAEAERKELITYKDRRDILHKRSTAVTITVIVATIVATLLAALPLHSLRVASLHKRYHEHYGTVVGPQTPVSTFGPGRHYLVRIRYPDWYGRTQTILVMDQGKLNPGDNVAVVVSKTKPPWTSDGLEETRRNPRESSIGLWLFAGIIGGFFIGVVLAIAVGNLVESRGVKAAIAV